MYKSTLPRYRDPLLRQRAADLRADGLRYIDIAAAVGVSIASVQRLLAPLPDFVPDGPKPTHCRSCGTPDPTRARGLCWRCAIDPNIRARFPSTSAKGRRGIPAPRGNRPRPTPTTATPGSDKKLLVLMARAERGERLWHDRDHQAERPAARVEVRVCRVAIESR